MPAGRPAPGTEATSSDIEELAPPIFHIDEFNYVWKRWLYNLYKVVFGTATTELSDSDLSNSWVNYGGTEEALGYWKDAVGNVYLQGTIKNGTIGAACYTLPESHRPVSDQRFPVLSNDTIGKVTINTSGEIIPDTPSSNVYVSLSGIVFRIL